MPDQQAPSIEWGLWFQWVLATTLGWAIGLITVGEIGSGVVVGLAQWLVLRSLLSRAGWWVLASALGWAIGWSVLAAAGMLAPYQTGLITLAVTGTVLGAALGIAQWLVLQPHVYRAGWWVLANMAGWTIGLTGLLDFTGILAGSLVGAVTGFVLDWLLRYPRVEVK